MENFFSTIGTEFVWNSDGEKGNLLIYHSSLLHDFVVVCKYLVFVIIWEKSTSLCLFFLSIELEQLISGALESLNGKPLTRKLSPFSSWLNLSHLCVYFGNVLWSGRVRMTFRKFGYPPAHRTFSAKLLSGIDRSWKCFRTSLKLLVGKISCRPNFSSLYLQFKSRSPLLCELFNSLNKSFSAGTSFTHFPIQIIPLFPLSEMSETEYFLAVYRTLETTMLFCVSFPKVPSGTSTFWPVLCYRGLLRALSRSCFLKMVWWLPAGKPCGSNMGSYIYLLYTFISIFFTAVTNECTCCFTDVEVMHSLLVIFESPSNQRCSPETSVLHPKPDRQIFCLADEW